jgi:hypothetical protein
MTEESYRPRVSDSALLQGSRNLGEERTSSGKLVDHRESESKVHGTIEIGETHGIRLSDAGIEPVQKTGFGRAALQYCEHPGLDVHGHYAAGGTR